MGISSIATSHNDTTSPPRHDPTIDCKSQAITHTILSYL
jgi:hypothetical protein